MQDQKYNILFGILLACLLLHFAFSPLNIIKDLPLNGYYKKPISVAFTLENYFSRKFQDSTEKSINYQFGLFPGFTRIHHQLEYSIFNRMYVRDVCRGEDKYLFRYCQGCLNDHQFDSLFIDSYVKQYSKLKDSLKAAGKDIVWIIAPDKNFIYSEFLPKSHPSKINGYYWSLKAAFKRKQEVLIDFNDLAYREKYKYPYPTFTKGGVHWTQAYAARCFDSLCNYLSETTSISIKNKIHVKESGNPWDPDYDIEQAANLLIPLEEKRTFYVADVITASAKNKKALLVGDSFCHVWMWSKWFNNCFHSESEFWYYNREANKPDNTFIKNLDHKNVRAYTSKFDIFIIVVSAANVEMLDFNFIKDVTNN